MKLPLRLAPNCLGELADLKDGDDRYVAHCAYHEDARAIMNIVNSHASIKAALDEAHAEVTKLRRHLARFSQSTDWHRERRRLMRDTHHDSLEDR